MRERGKRREGGRETVNHISSLDILPQEFSSQIQERILPVMFRSWKSLCIITAEVSSHFLRKRDGYDGPISSAAEIVTYTRTRNIVKCDNQPCRFKRSLPSRFPVRTRFLSFSTWIHTTAIMTVGPRQDDGREVLGINVGKRRHALILPSSPPIPPIVSHFL